MRVLLITNKVKGYTLGFQIVLNSLISLGHDVVWAADFSQLTTDNSAIPCKTVQISINSNPANRNNWNAYQKICCVISDEKINAIQCSTPIGGLLGRLAGRRMNVPLIIYAAHGFLHYKGAPLVNQTLYKWEEMWLAHYTDVLITINDEDFESGRKLRLRNGGKRYMIHGAGVDVGRKIHIDPAIKRAELGVSSNSFMLVSGGFLNQNKNNQVIIHALSLIKDRNVVYVACGDGEKLSALKALAHQLGVEERVIFPGFRTDFAEILACADAFVMPSFREGVPRSLLEAMDLGIPCIGSRTRGIRELIGENNDGGYLCDPRSAEEFADAITQCINQPEQMKRISDRNKEEAKKYSKEVVSAETTQIYKEVLNN